MRGASRSGFAHAVRNLMALIQLAALLQPADSREGSDIFKNKLKFCIESRDIGTLMTLGRAVGTSKKTRTWRA